MERDTVQALLDKGFALHRAGQAEAARDLYLAVLARCPGHAEARNLLGLALHQMGDNAAALRELRQAIELAPDNAHYHYNAGVVLQALGRPEDALRHYGKAIDLQPGYVLAHNNCGVIWRQLGDDEKARACYREALQYEPRSAELLNNLAATYRREADARQMLAYAEAALRERPDLAQAHVNKAYALGRQNRIDEALQALRQGLELDPSMVEEHSVYLMNMHYLEKFSAREIADEHRRWGRMHADSLWDGRPHGNDPDPVRRLRIGYVSQDFFFHSVAYFFEPLLEHHNRAEFEIYCYSSVREPDHVTARMRAQADEWREVGELSDAALAERIRQDRIDILVDLSGHTPGHRLLAFARKPAPIQMTYIGYPDTTGMRAMDYRITDAEADPVGVTDELHSETLVRLKHGFLSYRPNEFAPEVSSLPALRKGYVTFGSFNSFAKMSESCIRLWSRILQQLPDARLCLKYRNLTQQVVRENLLARFARHGVESRRIELLDHAERAAEHLALYDEIDIALDPFPYNGTATTCEALWMGVPVVSLAGEHHVSRVGLSLLSHVGMSQLAANSEDEYVGLAVALAGQLEDLARIRANLRPMMARSDLANGALLTHSMEQVYRALWQHYCRENLVVSPMSM